MIHEDQLPDDYKQFHSVEFCGNKMSNVMIPFTFKNSVPLLIGEGTAPHIWLSAPKDKDLKEWIPLVTNNRNRIKEIKIQSDSKNGETNIWLNDLPILKTRIENQVCICEFIDLKPIGLVISGDTDGLYFGGSKFKDNNFSNLKVMIGVAK